MNANAEAAKNEDAPEATADKVETVAGEVKEATGDVSAAVSEVSASGAVVADAAQATGQQVPVPAPQTVYVQAPQPPAQKGNRGFGILFAFIATLAFAAVFAGIGALIITFMRPASLDVPVLGFLLSPYFYVPVLVFLVLTILWALLVNRAGWWAWVLGSILIGVLTYILSVGLFLVFAGGLGMSPEKQSAALTFLALNPASIIAGVLARETSLWFGGAIAKRGRKVRERNYAAWQAFQQEHGAN